MTSRRDALRLTAAGLLGLALAPLMRPANAAYNIWTGEYTMTRQDIEAAVGKRFPTTLNYGQLLSVELTHPKIGFNPQANRVITQIDAQLQNVLLQGQPLAGVLSLSSALKYDPVKRAVLLDNPNVERVNVNGMPRHTTNN
ncbi:twin-arginine translocation signal domain-containing protein [Pandoraea sp. XY-2]|uniref:twin-arginine translocation signal domain-containing protein n=1 Tax=Pandoraea sp. XY-2 TaxID=2518599 RepID=UPI001F101A3E|nr:twin-arginine translocation signal domain-containing protein [Pandoraea sp. XY-2]